MKATGPVAVLTMLALGSVAQARDLRSSPPDAHPQGCQTFGTGFQQLDGVDSCIKIDGHVRVEATYNAGRDASFLPAASQR